MTTTNTPQPPTGYHIATPEERLKLPKGFLWKHCAEQPDWIESDAVGIRALDNCVYACPDLPADGAELVTVDSVPYHLSTYSFVEWVNARHREKVAALKLARDTDWQHWQGEKLELEERLAAAEKRAEDAEKAMGYRGHIIIAANELEKDRNNWREWHAEITAQRDALRAELAAVEPAMQSLRGMVSKLEAELSRLQWRTMDVKPTREDADAQGNVAVHMEPDFVWVLPTSTFPWAEEGFNPPPIRWLPLSSATSPTPVDTERAEMRAAFEAWSPSAQGGCHRVSPEEIFQAGFKAARAKEEPKP